MDFKIVLSMAAFDRNRVAFRNQVMEVTWNFKQFEYHTKKVTPRLADNDQYFVSYGSCFTKATTVNRKPLFMKHTLALLLLLLTLTGSCIKFRLFKCESYVPQKWALGEMEAELNTFKPVLSVGDPIHFYFKLPASFSDTLHRKVPVDKGVKIVVKISLEDDPAKITDNVFAVDTTIFHVFEQYFEKKIIKGVSHTAYDFSGVLHNGYWEIETVYTTRKRGHYWACITILEINSSAAELEDGVCMLGDPCFGAKLVWKPNENNRIDFLFNDSKQKYPEYYGFIVE